MVIPSAGLVLARARARMVAAASALVGRPPEGVQASTDRYNWSRGVPISPVGRNLTPDKIARYLREAEMGMPARMCELLEEIEDRDGHLVSVLGTRKRAVAYLPWRVIPADDRRKSIRTAELVTERLREIVGLEDAFVDLLDAVSKGYAVVEAQWYNRPSGAGVVSLDYKPQRWFVPSRDNPTVWRMLDAADSMEGVELTPWKHIVHVSRAKSGFPVKAGLGRVIVWWYLFKNYAVKDWATYLEVFGSPLRLGRYPMGTKPADIDALQAALDKLGVDASAVIPADLAIEFVGDRAPRTGGDTYERMMDRCDREVSKAVLGGTLTVDSGPTGARSLGEVHNGVRQDLQIADARALQNSIRWQLIAPIVAFNVGGDEPVPRFEICTEPPEDGKLKGETQKVRAEVFAIARANGVPIPLAQIQEELGIRAAGEGEELLSPSTAPEGAVLNRAGRHVHHACVFPFADRGEQLPSIIAQLETATQDYRTTGGQAAWAKLVTSIKAQLATASTLADVAPLFVKVIEGLRLDDLADELATATLTADLVGRAQVEIGDRPIPDLPKVPPKEAVDFWTNQVKVVTPDAFTALAAEHRSRAFTVSGFTSLSALQAVKGLLDDSIANGSTFSDFEDSINNILAQQGMEPRSAWQLETTFRTNTQTAYAVGRDVQQRTPAQLVLRPFWMYSTVEDSRVRPAHVSQDRKVYRYDSPYWAVWAPPNGFNCRCWKRALTADQVREMGLDVAAELPIDPASGRPQLPDEGFRRDPAREPHEFDWSTFPAEWRDALRVAA